MKSTLKAMLQIALVLVFALSLFGVSGAKAQQGGLTFTSSVQVVNLTSGTARITLHFYNPDGSEVGAPGVSDTIAGNSSKTYFPLTGVPAGFNGSMVVESDVQVVAITNLQTTDFLYGASTTGFSQNDVSQDFNLPLIMCNNSGFNTFFNVQNAGGSAETVDVTYVPSTNGKSGVTDSVTIQPGAAKTFDQAPGSTSGTKTCNDLKDASGKFIGGAKIHSTGPVVATVMELNTTTFKTLLGYNGFSTGSPSINLPLIMANNNSFSTSIQVQNTDPTATTTVTIKYAPNNGGSGAPADEVFSLSPGQTKVVIQNSAPPSNGSTNNWNTIGRYIGGATISSNPNVNLVAVVNETSTGLGSGGPYGSSFEGFNPGNATPHVTLPLIQSNNSGFYTSIMVQNVQNLSGTSCSVTVHYNANTAGSFAPKDEVFTLTQGQAWTVIQNSAPPSNGSTVNNWNGVGKYIGSAEITASSCNVVGIVNQQRFSTPGDTLFTYDGYNHP
jgi:hypothetical protein